MSTSGNFLKLAIMITKKKYRALLLTLRGVFLWLILSRIFYAYSLFYYDHAKRIQF